MDEKRLDELEVRLSYLEDYLSQLNDVVLENGRRLGTMERVQKLIQGRLDELAENLPAPESQKPPHY